MSVRPGEKRTLWLDLRDRLLTSDSFCISIASAATDFNAASLDGAAIRLVFKPRAEALREHIADRFNQVKDNWGFLVEEHTASKRAALYRRLYGDISDLLRVDPDNVEARRYWADISYGATGWPAFTQPAAPAGVPLWAFRQLEDLKLVRQFIDWWIDQRQVPFGDSAVAFPTTRSRRAVAGTGADGRRAGPHQRVAARAVRCGVCERHDHQRTRHHHHRRAARLRGGPEQQRAAPVPELGRAEGARAADEQREGIAGRDPEESGGPPALRLQLYRRTKDDREGPWSGRNPTPSP